MAGRSVGSFLYPRTITILRPAHQDAPDEGIMPYGGVDQDAMASVASDIICNVQARGTARRNGEQLPGDATVYLWNINIPLGQAADGVIKDRDLATDDLGRRFVIESAYCHSMGWKLGTSSLEN